MSIFPIYFYLKVFNVHLPNIFLFRSVQWPSSLPDSRWVIYSWLRFSSIWHLTGTSGFFHDKFPRAAETKPDLSCVLPGTNVVCTGKSSDFLSKIELLNNYLMYVIFIGPRVFQIVPYFNIIMFHVRGKGSNKIDNDDIQNSQIMEASLVFSIIGCIQKLSCTQNTWGSKNTLIEIHLEGSE